MIICLEWLFIVTSVLSCYRARGIPFDAIFMQTCLYVLVENMMRKYGTDVCWVWMPEYILLGYVLAGLERYGIGWWNHLPCWEIKHENYHHMLRMRKLDQRWRPLEHIIECVSYVVLFSVLAVVMNCVEWNGPTRVNIWIGLLLEHV